MCNNKELRFEPTDRGNAIFHQWGVDYKEFEVGIGSYTVAIVEWPDGTVEEILPRFIRFIDTVDKSTVYLAKFDHENFHRNREL